MSSTRPNSYDEFSALMGDMLNPKGVAKGLAFQPRPTDVIISPYGKCGTTWLQQMIHTLRTRGDLDHDDISAVVPWIETSHDLRYDLDAPQRGAPRAYKSHLSWHAVPKGARYVVSFRDPKDAALSMFRFMEGWFFEPGAIEPDEFVERNYLAQAEERDYWTHLSSWWEQRDRDDVLLLSYENMVADPEAAIRTVADFVGIALDDELLALTRERTSLAFMLAHKHLFDDRGMREHSEKKLGLPAGSDSSKVREGKVGASHSELSDSVQSLFDEVWSERIASKHGLSSYAELASLL